MILRRISDALRRQDWATVAIEFVLIFASVILALQFDNWNTERREIEREHEVLAAIAEDLKANIDTFLGNIEFDENSIAACEKVINTIETKAEWTVEIGASMFRCRWWTSPYLHSAAYSGLRSSGTDLISNPILRRDITRLYENEYNSLINDSDRAFWDFQTSVIVPTMNRTMRPKKSEEEPGRFDRVFLPIDYEDLQEDEEFRTMLYNKQRYQAGSVFDQRKMLERTREVLTAIEAELGDVH